MLRPRRPARTFAHSISADKVAIRAGVEGLGSVQARLRERGGQRTIEGRGLAPNPTCNLFGQFLPVAIGLSKTAFGWVGQETALNEH